MKTLDLIKLTLAEDIQTGDITSSLLIDPETESNAIITVKADGVFCGNQIISDMDHLIDSVSISSLVEDGQAVNPGDHCVRLVGQTNQIVQIERTLLNFLQRLSGIATTTQSFVSALNDSTIQILDTRKTTPLLRHLEKAAVVAGGGFNHRFGLYDMVLVKENHLNSYIKSHGILAFNQKIESHKQTNASIQIEIEVSSFDLLKSLDLTHIDIIMFDNMTLTDLDPCINYLNQHAPDILKEVSGNISLDSISRYQGIDIDRISVGSLTHSVKALDLSLLIL